MNTDMLLQPLQIQQRSSAPEQIVGESRAEWRRANTKKRLFQSLKEQKLHQNAEFIFKWWPNLEEVAINYSEHLGESLVTESRRSFCYDVIARAVRAYDEEFAVGDNREAAAHAFLIALVDSAEDLLQFRVYVTDEKGRSQTWDMFNRAWADWYKDFVAAAKVQIEPALVMAFGDQVWAAKRMLAAKVMRPIDFYRFCCDVEASR